MYSTSNSWSGSSMDPEHSNNPFLEGSASSRYPDLSAQLQQDFQAPSPYASHTNSPLPQSPYGQQYQQQWNTPSSGLPQQGYSSPVGYGSFAPQQTLTSPTSFYPPNAQQYGQVQYSQQQQSPMQYAQQPQLTGYPGSYQQQMQPSQEQLQLHLQGVVNQFDPYSGVSPGWSGQPQSPTQGTQVAPPQSSTGTSTNAYHAQGQQHPRQFVQSRKAQLETWHGTTWSEAFGTFESLRRAWEKRRADLQSQIRTGQYLSAEETGYLNSLIKTAEANIDTTAASLLQMQEVFSGYKHSVDPAGRQRVRQALNAGLQGLPDWP